MSQNIFTTLQVLYFQWFARICDPGGYWLLFLCVFLFFLGCWQSAIHFFSVTGACPDPVGVLRSLCSAPAPTWSRCCAFSLEAELHAQLNLAGAGGEVGPADLGRGVPKDVRVRQKSIRLIELHTVEEIIELEAHVEFHPLANSHLLVQD